MRGVVSMLEPERAYYRDNQPRPDQENRIRPHQRCHQGREKDRQDGRKSEFYKVHGHSFLKMGTTVFTVSFDPAHRT